MAPVDAFYSVNEAPRPPSHRRYHNNDACPSGRDIPQGERPSGHGRLQPHENCARLG